MRRGVLRPCEPARTPIAPVEWIDTLTFDLVGLVVPHGWKAEILDAVDLNPASDAERTINSEDFARWARDNLGLKPPMLRATSSVQLPDKIRGHPAEVSNHDLFKLTITNRAAHGGPCANPVPSNERFALHPSSTTPSHYLSRLNIGIAVYHPRTHGARKRSGC